MSRKACPSRQCHIVIFSIIQGEEVVSGGVRLVTRLRFIYGILVPQSGKDLPPTQTNKSAFRQNLLPHLGQAQVNYVHYDSDISEED